jgi:drug/metabolite transporter (DMT)-like permease
MGDSPRRAALRADLALLLLALIWGSSFAVVKKTLELVDPFVFLAARFTCAVAISAPLVLLRERERRRERASTGSVWRAGLLAGAFLFAGFSTQTLGLRSTTASNSAFITGLSVVLVPLFQTLGGRRRSGAGTWFAAVLAAAGLALLTQPGSGWNRGDLWTLGCAVAFAAHILTLEAFAPRGGVLRLYFLQILVVATGSWIFVLAGSAPMSIPSPGAWASVLYMGLAATALAFVIQTWAQTRTTAARTALLLTLEPVFAASIAAVALQEILGAWGILGGALILAAILVSVWFDRGIPARR